MNPNWVGKLCADTEPEEGLETDVYRDSKGYWTIGIGHLVSRDKTLTAEQARALCGAPWTEAKCRSVFREDIERHVREAEAQWPWVATLPELQWRGICQMVFQMGVPTVKKFQQMLLALQRKDWAVAEIEALDSDWARHDTPARARRVAARVGGRERP